MAFSSDTRTIRSGIDGLGVMEEPLRGQHPENIVIEWTPEAINEAVARKLGCTFSGDRHPPQFKDYCHSIEAAWEILTDHCDTWEIFCNGSTVDVTLSKSHNTAGHEADTAPMAICLAFLKLDDK